jgi:uncharacterized cupin superfamily protein
MIVDAKLVPTSGQDGMHTDHVSAVPGGVTQYGAYVDTLQPNAWSSHRHWHTAEDEFILVLDGVVTLRDDDGMTDLLPGDAVCWRHGDPNAHHLTNRGTLPCRYLIVGSRAAGDICHYPDDGRRQINGQTTWSVQDKDGVVLRSGDLSPDLLNLPPLWGTPFDGKRRPNVIRKGSVKAVDASGDDDDGFDNLGDSHFHPISDEGGLTQFGAFTETLMPGAQSSQRHWHANEDEFLYVLHGTVTLIENEGPHSLHPGDCACWPAGVANAHCLRNDSDTPVTYFIAGTRLPDDTVTYPDIDLHYTRKGGMRMLTHKDGTPYPGWPKETTR